MANLLLVDDDAHIREVMRFALEKAGHQVREAADGAAAFALFTQHPFDLVVLDIVMPEMDGLELCRKIRAHGALPIIFVSSRDEELDRILGLELGGDDYLTKPFSPRELSARVAAVLRRSAVPPVPAGPAGPAGPPVSAGPAEPAAKPESVAALRHGAVVLDRARHQCWVSGRELILTVTEFELFRALLEAPGRVFSRGQLVEHAYGAGHYISDRTVDSHIRRLRQKLGAEAEQVETVYGVGYRLRE